MVAQIFFVKASLFIATTPNSEFKERNQRMRKLVLNAPVLLIDLAKMCELGRKFEM